MIRFPHRYHASHTPNAGQIEGYWQNDPAVAIQPRVARARTVESQHKAPIYDFAPLRWATWAWPLHL